MLYDAFIVVGGVLVCQNKNGHSELRFWGNVVGCAGFVADWNGSSVCFAWGFDEFGGCCVPSC